MPLSQEEIDACLVVDNDKRKEQTEIYMKKQKQLCREMGTKAYVKMVVGEARKEIHA